MSPYVEIPVELCCTEVLVNGTVDGLVAITPAQAGLYIADGSLSWSHAGVHVGFPHGDTQALIHPDSEADDLNTATPVALKLGDFWDTTGSVLFQWNTSGDPNILAWDAANGIRASAGLALTNGLGIPSLDEVELWWERDGSKVGTSVVASFVGAVNGLITVHVPLWSSFTQDTGPLTYQLVSRASAGFGGPNTINVTTVDDRSAVNLATVGEPNNELRLVVYDDTLSEVREIDRQIIPGVAGAAKVGCDSFALDIGQSVGMVFGTTAPPLGDLAFEGRMLSLTKIGPSVTWDQC